MERLNVIEMYMVPELNNKLSGNSNGGFMKLQADSKVQTEE